MTSAAHPHDAYDQTRLPLVLRWSVQLGVVEALLVLAFSVGSRFLEGPLELVVQSIIVLVGLAAVTLLPGLWTRARTIEGIAGAAGIGLGAAAIYLAIDVVALRWIGTYTNRWFAIGGGSNWWWHPVWWMVGTYLPWMGAFALANQTRRTGEPGPAAAFGASLLLALLLGVIAAVIGVPGSAIGLPTFAIAYLPALALTVLITGRGWEGREGRAARRG